VNTWHDMGRHLPVKGEGSDAHCWEKFDLQCDLWEHVSRTLHITTTPYHCAASQAVNCKMATELTNGDSHEYYQVNCCCSVSHRIAGFVAMDNVQHTANLEHF